MQSSNINTKIKHGIKTCLVSEQTVMNKIRWILNLNMDYLNKKNTHINCKLLQTWSAKKQPVSIDKQLGSERKNHVRVMFTDKDLCVLI